jgi:hypothetical protein
VAALLQEFLDRELAAVLVEADGRLRRDAPRPAAVLAGAFNPLHAGHLELSTVAADLLKVPVGFELCVCNVDKPPLDASEISDRLEQFAGRAPVWLTRAPTFAEKALLFPGAVFVVGADTAERILALRYYAAAGAGLQQAFEQIRGNACRFLVAARRDERGALLRLSDLDVAQSFRDLFEEIPPARFEREISSTQLRRRGA